LPTLVDAYNVLHVVGVLPPELAGIDLEELAALLEGSRFDRDEVLLICDGVPKPHQVGGDGRVHVRFAGAGTTADELIMRLVQKSSAPRRLTVVSSDREIAQHARRRRATVLSSESFLASLAEDHATKHRSGVRTARRPSGIHPADRRQVEKWLKLFNLDDDLLSLDSLAAEKPRRSEDLPKKTADSTPPPAASPDDSPKSVIDAGHLDEIRLEDVEKINMSDLLDDTGQLRRSPADDQIPEDDSEPSDQP
jgi:predicted RNA-binding protein with PIN domain